VRLTCNQKLVKASLIYRTEPKQNRICKGEEGKGWKGSGGRGEDGNVVESTKIDPASYLD